MKNKTIACKKAHTIMTEMEEKMLAGYTPTIEEMSEYNTVHDFCMIMTQGEAFKEYNRTAKGAVYPEDVGYEETHIHSLDHDRLKHTDFADRIKGKDIYNVMNALGEYIEALKNIDVVKYRALMNEIDQIV